MKLFDQQIAIVTGAGKGIGYEIARQLALGGATVILNDIDALLCVEAAERISGEGGKCFGIVGDCSDRAFINEMVAIAEKQKGRLQVVIANAGITLFGDFFQYTPESFDRVLKVNLAGSFFLAQESARRMRDHKSGGSILFMSSVTGHQAHKDLAAYGMTKAALEMLAKNLVIELSPFGITVNALAPGATLTERTMEDPAYRAVWSKLTPMGKPADTREVADAALFLVSPLSKHITGQTLVIDGGWTSVSPNP